MHPDVGEEFLSGIFEGGPEEIDYIVDDQEAVMIMLAGINCNRRVLLVVALHIKLLLDLAIVEDAFYWGQG